MTVLTATVKSPLLAAAHFHVGPVRRARNVGLAPACLRDRLWSTAALGRAARETSGSSEGAKPKAVKDDGNGCELFRGEASKTTSRICSTLAE
jgi:hypothetical protein